MKILTIMLSIFFTIPALAAGPYVAWSVPTAANPVSVAVNSGSTSIFVGGSNVEKFNSAGGRLWYLLASSAGVATDGSSAYYLGLNKISKLSTLGVLIYGPMSTDVAPVAVTADSAGNTYVACSGANTINKFSNTGALVWSVPTAGLPYSLTLDNLGNIYVGNYTGGSLQKFNTATGSIIWTYPGLSNPRSVSTDQSGNIFVACFGDNTIKKLDPAGTLLQSVPTGSGPISVAVDTIGNAYVACYNSNTIQKFDNNLNFQWSTPTGTGPISVAVDGGPVANIYVVNYGSNTLTKYGQTCTSPRFPAGWQTPGSFAAGQKIQATDVNSLRTDIDLMRSNAGLSACVGSFYSQSIVQGAKIKAADMTEMRGCVLQVYDTCGISRPANSVNTSAVPGTQIKSTEWVELWTAIANAP